MDGERVMLIENRINISLCPGITEVDFNKQKPVSDRRSHDGAKN